MSARLSSTYRDFDWILRGDELVRRGGAQERVRRSIEVWADTHLGDVSDNTWELTLISPSRFARFVAYQMASLI